MAKSSLTYCPHCGTRLTISAPPDKTAGRYQRQGVLQSSHRLHSIAVADTPELPGEWQKVTPVARLTTQDVTTSIYDAGISGLLVTVGGLGICWYFEQPFIIAPASGFAVLLWRYWGGMSLAKGLLEIIETATHRDGDGHAGPPPEPAPPQRVQVEIRDRTEAGQQWRFHEFEIEPYKLHDLATLVINGASFSERTAKSPGITQEEFRNLRDKFIVAGFAIWSHPTRKQQGVSLTRAGQTVLRAIAASPTPDPDHAQNAVLDARSSTQHGRGAQ